MIPEDPPRVERPPRLNPGLYYGLVGLVWVAGNLTPLLLVWLLWPRQGPVKPVPASGPDPLLVDFFLALVFPLQHSIWTQPPVKRWLLARLGEHAERPAYVLASGAALALTVLLWRGSDRLLGRPPVTIVWGARALITLAVAAQLWCTTVIGAKFLTGLAHLKTYRQGRPLRPPEFRERGLYRWVRHPIAASQLLMLWSVGALYADRLLLAGLWTGWILLATTLEDRRLAAEFGPLYADYRRRAGFLLPRLRLAGRS